MDDFCKTTTDLKFWSNRQPENEPLEAEGRILLYHKAWVRTNFQFSLVRYQRHDQKEY